MFKLIFAATTMLWTIVASAQEYSIHGKVEHASGGLPLAGATFEVKELKQITVTDEFGNFAMTKLPAGEYTASVRFLGFAEQVQKFTLVENLEINFVLEETQQMTDEVVVFATRANEKTPATFLQIDKLAIQKQNFGQDLPLLLNWTPSLVSTSDAGAGIGYTGLRIRGSDASRINVTINGIALNDSESQGVFWVNTPDLASSVQSIQVQRGVGTSTNGAGAFGATVNVLTDALVDKPYAEGVASAGSFHSQRYTFKIGTGLVNNRWSFDGRVSKIKSNGYLERATSDLNSYYISGGYYGKSTIVKAIIFGGHEQTYQAWYGIDPATLEIDRRFNYAGAIYDSEGNVVRFYDNEVDNYLQNHYQLHISQRLSENWNANISGHYTHGRGYFEQYKQDESFSALGLANVTIGDSTLESSDVVVRRWLDNDYYGSTFSIDYTKDKMNLIIGGALSQYANARHFGEIIWSAIATASPIRYVYYDGESGKTDFNIYVKWNYSITDKLNSFVDLQYRAVNYETTGIEDNQIPYMISDQFRFFNPKAGFTYTLAEKNMLYISYAIANREPNRSDYLDGIERPTSEQLGNLELGWKKSTAAYILEANYYLMNYTDQLVLTGAVSDTGYPIRANVGKSYRTGIELSGSANLSSKINWRGNITWSVNKNKDYAVLDENNNVTNQNTTIILSPSWIGGSEFTLAPLKNFQASLLSKYVGQQFLDNSESDNVKLDSYFVNDIRLSYIFRPTGLEAIELGLLVNNIFDVAYSSNGYGYGGVPYFFPQAGTNFMAMLKVKI
ncbi:MAG: TonB-dependent receptor [Cyclobacteriaceae bacterium]|nr:TonB-dependent receptor [Cyclobacteriaceae bacterium]MDH4297836.1 TonB-dependent receptor [Cyclobacteriaceae bacterium]MDH5247403.1 TonB-dependent receptor [Cyclobacteriaceae bacterium]